MTIGLGVILAFFVFGLAVCGWGLFESSRAKLAIEGSAAVALLVIPGGLVAVCSFFAFVIWLAIKAFT
jgi:hypothetical protein